MNKRINNLDPRIRGMLPKRIYSFLGKPRGIKPLAIALRLKHIVFLIVGLLVLNFSSQRFYNRLDLTKDKRYTLSKVTNSILQKANKQLIVRVYLEGDFPSEFKRLQIETRQFLEELKAKKPNIIIQFINPENKRERLVKKGMLPSQLTVEENGKLSNAIIFPWAEISYENKAEIISLLPNGVIQSQEKQFEAAIENLEFSFSNAIHNVTQKNKQKVAVLKGNNELEDIKVYSFLNDVRKKYRLAAFTLDSTAKNAKRTLQDIQNFDLLVIAKPTEAFTEKEKMVLDQFIMNGGKTLWMLEKVQADTDSLYNSGKMLAYPRDLNLTDLLFSYGIRINTSLIQDLYSSKIPLATGNIGNQTQFQSLPWFYHPLVGGNPNNAISKNVAPVRLRFTNQIDTLQNNIKKTPLLVSSSLTKRIGTPNLIELQSIEKEPKEGEYNSGYQLFGVLLEGKFKSNYSNRIKPFDIEDFSDNSSENKMIIIADGDIGRNQIQKGQPYDLAIDKWTGEQFGNKEFLLNAVDYLLDDSGLIELRNKTLQINLLDKQRAFEDRTYWQFLNIILPIVILFGFGFGFHFWRKKKYS